MTSTSDKIIQNIDKLKENGENYLTWFSYIKLYLQINDNTKHLTEDPPEAADDKAKFLKADAIIKFMICCTISEKLILDVEKYQTTKKVISYLESTFNSKSAIYTGELIASIIQNPLKEDGNLQQYLREYKNKMYLLEQMKWRESENLEAMMLIALLPSKYDGLLTALQSKDLGSITISELEIKLTEEERKIKKTLSSALKDDLAFKVDQQFGRNPKFHTSSKFCNYCKTAGHSINECRVLKKKKQYQDQAPSTDHAQTANEDDEEFCFMATEMGKTKKDLNPEEATAYAMSTKVKQNFKINPRCTKYCDNSREVKNHRNNDSVREEKPPLFNEGLKNNSEFKSALFAHHHSTMTVANGGDRPPDD